MGVYYFGGLFIWQVRVCLNLAAGSEKYKDDENDYGQQNGLSEQGFCIKRIA